MRVLIIILVLVFSLQSWSKADDISDFEIEGISIGHTLLDYLSKDYIENTKLPIFRGGKEHKEYHKVQLKSSSELYERVLLYYRTNDPNIIIKAIVGRVYFENNINECYALQKNIVNELESIFTQEKKLDRGKIKNLAFPDGDSYKNDVSFYFKDGSMVHIACYDFSSKDTTSVDRLSVGIYSKEYFEWFLSLKQ